MKSDLKKKEEKKKKKKEEECMKYEDTQNIITILQSRGRTKRYKEWMNLQ